MKRVIVDYKKMTSEVLKLLVEAYPEGYEDSDIISFRNIKGELIKAVEVNTEDTKYLVKISASLEQSMAYYVDDDEDNQDDDFQIEEATGIEEDLEE